MASRRDEEKEGPLGHSFCVCLSHTAILLCWSGGRIIGKNACNGYFLEVGVKTEERGSVFERDCGKSQMLRLGSWGEIIIAYRKCLLLALEKKN